MGIYDRCVLPRLIDLGMRNAEVRRYRAQLVPLARGTVLEVGIGSGLNLPFYGSGVDRIIGIDISERLLAMARRKGSGARFPIELLAHSAEEIPLANQTVDTVVCTFTLCSIPDPLRALREMRRVLRPGGELLFAEHGLAPDPSVQRWQQRLTPCWRAVAGGCHLDRKMDALVTAGGFAATQASAAYAKGPRILSYVYVGHAHPA